MTLDGRDLAIIAPDCANGGSVGAVAWRHAVELSRWFDVHVVSAAVPEPPNPRILPVVVTPRRWTFLRRFCHVPNELSFQCAARKALGRLCASTPIATVWCHGHASVVLAACPLRRRYGFRVAMTTHGDIWDRPPGTYSRELTCYYRAVTRRAYREADTTQALSPYMAEWARRGGARGDQVAVIPNGVDPAEIGLEAINPRPAESYLPDGRLRLLYVGGLLTIKGVDVLLHAVAALRASIDGSAGTMPLASHAGLRQEGAAPPSVGGALRRGGQAGELPACDLLCPSPERGRPPPCLVSRTPGAGFAVPPAAWTSISLTLVGDGPERGSLEGLALSLGIQNSVRFTGRVPRSRLAAVYGDADALCIPSRSEALPTVGLEAMLCGVPVVGSRTGGIPFIVQEGVTGRLAVPGDATALAASISAVAASREQLARMGKAAQQRAGTEFSWSRIAEQLRQVAEGGR